MTDLTCAEVREMAPEFALDILPDDERDFVSHHLDGCPACREEIYEMKEVGTRLLDLIPGTEPPLGFDRRALARTGIDQRTRRPRFRMIVTLAAAAAIAVATTVGVDLNHSHSARPALAEADLRQGDRTVGDVYVYPSHPTWMVMSVKGLGTDGPVTCEMLSTANTVIWVGNFKLDRGTGSWGAPDPLTPANTASIRLVDSQGNVLAVATF